MASDLLAFVKAFSDSWGGTLLYAEGFIALVERFLPEKWRFRKNNRAWLAVAAVFFVWASFDVWRQEHHLRVAAESKSDTRAICRELGFVIHRGEKLRSGFEDEDPRRRGESRYFWGTAWWPNALEVVSFHSELWGREFETTREDVEGPFVIEELVPVEFIEDDLNMLNKFLNSLGCES